MLIDPNSDLRPDGTPFGRDTSVSEACPETAVHIPSQVLAQAKRSRRATHVQAFGRPGTISGLTPSESGRTISPEVSRSDSSGQSIEWGRASSSSLEDSEVTALIKFLEILDRWDREASQKGGSQMAA